MKKIERRAIMCLLLAVVLLTGLCIFVYRDITQGANWATFQGNRDVYANGKLAKGRLLDRHGELLLKNTADGPEYNDSDSVRAGCMHITGDPVNNIATGADRVFVDRMIGYSFVNGIHSIEDAKADNDNGNSGRTIKLTLDGSICATAYEAMDGRRGTVGVYNYMTGEILCMVSGPTYDPAYPPDADDVEKGTYLNNFISSRYAPGSTYKLVTAAAAIETQSDAYSYEYDCDGSEDYGHGDKVTDLDAHGTVDLEEALEVSCNCYFGKMSEKVGGSTLKKYTEYAGLMKSYDIDGIETAKGTFDFPDRGVNLAWTGIGQYHDMVNPCAMMVFAGSIANGGKATMPYIIDPTTSVGERVTKLRTRTEKMIEAETAASLKDMMRNNVEEHYDPDSNFPELDSLCAKTGTAEVEGQDSPNSWFVGFLDDQEHPYAFVVVIEEGGYGIDAAGSVANRVLEDAISY